MIETQIETTQLQAKQAALAELQARRAAEAATAKQWRESIPVLERQIDSALAEGSDPSRLEKRLHDARESLETAERHVSSLDRSIAKSSREIDDRMLGDEKTRLEIECDGDQGAARAWKARYVELCRELGAHLAAGVTLHVASKVRAERLASLTSRRDFSPTETDIYEDAVAFGRLRDELAEEAAELAYRDGGRRLRFDVPVFGVTGRPA